MRTNPINGTRNEKKIPVKEEARGRPEILSRARLELLILRELRGKGAIRRTMPDVRECLSTSCTKDLIGRQSESFPGSKEVAGVEVEQWMNLMLIFVVWMKWAWKLFTGVNESSLSHPVARDYSHQSLIDTNQNRISINCLHVIRTFPPRFPMLTLRRLWYVSPN